MFIMALHVTDAKFLQLRVLDIIAINAKISICARNVSKKLDIATISIK